MAGRRYYKLTAQFPKNRMWLVQAGIIDPLPRGQRMEFWDSRQIVMYPPGGWMEWDFATAIAGQYDVFSPRLQTLIQVVAPEQIQFLPIRYQQDDGSGEVLGYAIGTALAKDDCLKGSALAAHWTALRGNEYRGSDPVPDTVSLGDLFESSDSRALIVSDNLRSEMVKARITGCCLTPIAY